MIRVYFLRRIALFAVATLVAMVCVTGIAPLMQTKPDALAFDEICSAHGAGAHVAAGDTSPSNDTHDHVAHCPLCMPCGAPPPVFVVARVEPAQPLAHVRQSIPAARLASLVGAPLPARGPPSLA